LGYAASFGSRVGCTCTGAGVPICIGCPQPANTSTISSIYQRRTLAYTNIENKCSNTFYHAPMALSSANSSGDILMSPAILYTEFKLLASGPKVPSKTGFDYFS